MSASLGNDMQVVGQAISKLRGGATEREVMDWLREELEVGEADAGTVVTRARGIHLRVVRMKSIIFMIAAAMGILAAVGMYFYFTSPGVAGMTTVGYGWMLILSVAIISGAVFVFSFVRFLLALN